MRKGFYDLLGKDGDLLTALAVISLQLMIGAENKTHVEEILRSIGIDFQWAMDRFRAVEQQTGAQVVGIDHNGGIWCRV